VNTLPSDHDAVAVVTCGDDAKPTDLHFASWVHCVDGEIVQWLRAARAAQAAARRYR
jgi:hypothetical protein